METAVPMPDISPKNNLPEPMPADTYREQYANFIAIASHDLRAPLRKLGVLTDRLLARVGGNAGEEVGQYTNRIQACISEMQSLVDGFAEMAGTAGSVVHHVNCDIEKMIEKLLLEFSGAIRDKKANVLIGPIPPISADKHQMKLVFRKILENSFKFSRDSVPLRIEISSVRASEEEIARTGLPAGKAFQKIKVTDNGIGFDASKAEHIFQPLVRLHGKSSFRGNGLGLYLVKLIIENHNGVVFAEGTAEGAAISILLPENQV